jgi:hypothetical protein
MRDAMDGEKTIGLLTKNWPDAKDYGVSTLRSYTRNSRTEEAVLLPLGHTCYQIGSTYKYSK